jgi:uncharacterized SAM-binding protein YcdF (DUF218 family)
MTSLVKFLLPLFSPLGIALCMLTVATALLFLGRGACLRWTKVLVPASLIVLLLSALPTFSVPAIRALEYEFPSIEADTLRKAEVDTIVVLGAGVLPCEGRPITSNLSRPSVLRLVEGIRLYQQLTRDRPTTLILSGRGEYETEASQMASLARQLGVPSRDIELEEQSMDTADQAKLLESRLGSRPFALVTSASHMPRSMRTFRALGLNPIAAPTAHLSTPAGGGRARILLSLPHCNNIQLLERVLYEHLGSVRTNFEIDRALEESARDARQQQPET